MQFVSEKDIEEVKAKRQEEWEQVRRPDQPLQRPEEDYDNRTLYEKLKVQKDQKQEERDEQFKFKNMIYKGLNDEEASFLRTVADRQAEIESEKRKEEDKELSSFREAVEKIKDEESLKQHRMEHSSSSSFGSAHSSGPTHSTSLGAATTSVKKPKSQLALLAGSIKTKRKRSQSDQLAEEISPEKRAKVQNSTVSDTKATASHSSAPPPPSPPPPPPPPPSALPGLTAYSSSDEDSEN